MISLFELDHSKLAAHKPDFPKPEELRKITKQGAKTVAKHREAFLMDWVKRWEWLK
ncbi:hypothetical protein J2X69_004973 [Algoriphagus sp. 4150]|uniref:hypothetical protein n=1 Tax=Algoriphagus sp. 4150 TaxID=2817756 RepID=UPI0028659591|nr:hypothetical protein [Algoriphagus sp. 4150]MDR7132599.1 hypothetical protein [Algoriphagus sp. 4150]